MGNYGIEGNFHQTMTDPNKYRNYNSNLEAPKMKCRELRVTDIICGEFDDIEERVGILESEMATLQTDINQVETRTTAVEGEIDQAQTDVTTLQDKTQNISATTGNTTMDLVLVMAPTTSIYIANAPYNDTSTQKLRLHQSGLSAYVDFSGDGKLQMRYGTTTKNTKFTIDGVQNNCVNVGAYYGQRYITNYTSAPQISKNQIGYTTRIYYSSTTDTINNRQYYYISNPTFQLTSGIWLIYCEIVLTSTGAYTGQVWEAAVALCNIGGGSTQLEYVQAGVHYSAFNFNGGYVSAYGSNRWGLPTLRHQQIYKMTSGYIEAGMEFIVTLSGTVQVEGPRSFVQFTRIG